MAARPRQWRARDGESEELSEPPLAGVGQPDPGGEDVATDVDRFEAEVPALEEIEPNDWWHEQDAREGWYDRDGWSR